MNLFRSATTIVTVPKNRSPLRRALLLIPLVLVCFGLLPIAKGTPDPLAVNGARNTADGTNALVDVTTGTNNSGFGYFALHDNTIGNGNTATGAVALSSNEIGSQNTADGAGALGNNVGGNNNTAIGVNALKSANRLASDNTAVGHSALLRVFDTGFGFGFNGSLNVGIGYKAGSGLTSGSGNVCIGANVLGKRDDFNTIRIGKPGGTAVLRPPKTFIAGIREITPANADAIAVVIDSAGQLGTVSSSERFKKEIKPMDKASEAILALKPVTFHYKSDSTNTPQFGLIAEEVARVNPDLVVRDDNGEIYTVRYEAVNAMLLNEFLKAHRLLEEQQTTIERQQKQIDSLAAGLQKVNHQMELGKTAAQTVAAND